MKFNHQFFVSGVTVACLSILSPSSVAEEARSTVGDGIELKQGEAIFKITGRILFDYDYFDGIHNNGKTGRGTELRRGRLHLKGLFKKWEGKIQVELNDQTERAQFKDAYVKYRGWNDVSFILGKAKEPFSLEVSESSKYLATIERAMVSEAFGPSRSYGLGLFTQRGNATVAGGIYVEGQNEDNKETYAWTGRATYAPIITNDAIIHLGLSGSFRDMDGSDYQIKQRAEVHKANKIVESGTTVADNLLLLGLEAAAVFGPFSVRSEYMMADVEAQADSGDNSANYDGYYVEASYFLTGDSREYKGGRFRKLKSPKVNGAWQLLARFSHLDARDNNEGVEADNMTLGINYYASQNIRISANYLLTDIEDSNAAEPNDNEGEALSFRFQYLF